MILKWLAPLHVGTEPPCLLADTGKIIIVPNVKEEVFGQPCEEKLKFRKTKEKQWSVNEVIEMFVTLSPLVLEGVSGVEHVSL